MIAPHRSSLPVVPRRLRRLVLMAAAAAGFSAGSAQAAGDAAATLKKACRSDYATHCASVRPGGGRVLACMQQNRAALSPACRTALDRLPQTAGPAGAGKTPAPTQTPGQPAPRP